MKEHILAALEEQLKRWEDLLANLREEQINSPQFDLGWSVKDVIAHLWAWQQISIARMEAGTLDREPHYPQWIVSKVENWEENPDQVNAVTFERQHDQPWMKVHQDWRNGYLRCLELGNRLSERQLLDSDRYPWLNGYSLALTLISSYAHHQEHIEKLQDWLKES